MTKKDIIATASIDLAPIFEQYRIRLVNRQRQDQTVYNFQRACVPFQTWLEARDLAPEDLTEDDIYAYFAASVYSKSTINAHAGQIRAAYEGLHPGFAPGDDLVTGIEVNVPVPGLVLAQGFRSHAPPKRAVGERRRGGGRASSSRVAASPLAASPTGRAVAATVT